ncbi:endonuclease 8-like 2 [Erinaceus europaeus]|uniref:DNA-(apurinic or apyrimidinic site) lyase n=1 Tax=Erinaceus europaeus TaxID=9365 RepID=A0ABM3WWH4_ERIEU|nr:endonuclease 8-like 2 [Erinaceus europaeus]XP_060040916.1 endonuclease 8-like 2 [Erinaceus europaeus]XP_060040917.1 endonuclease 8-like 2 [Erinaceus europaeus]
MPEGPSVRKFHHLVTPFVGQQVVKTGGSSKKLNPADFQSLWLQDTQVHGKKLFLRFDSDEEIELPGSRSPPEPLQKRKKEARDQKQVLGPKCRKISDTSLRSPECPVPSGDSSGSCVGGDAPANSAEKWLQLSFGMFGSIWVNEFSRAKKANKRGDWRDPIPRLVLHFGGGGFLAFYNCQMSWGSCPVVTPTSDILSEHFHRGQALEALGQAQPVCYTLLDQRHFSGLGNIIKNEVLFRAGIHPLSLGSTLSPPRLEALLDQVLDFSACWLQGKLQSQPQHTQIYQKESCPAGHRVQKEALGPAGGLKRLTWWCPQCQPQEPSEESLSDAPIKLQTPSPSPHTSAL